MRVFVYGSLMRGFHNHRLLRGSRFVSWGYTAPEFTMVDLGSYPGVVRGGTTALRGEVYEVSTDTLAKLDVLEGHPKHYKRETELIETDGGHAIAYIYILQHGADRELPPVVEHGDWRLFTKEGPGT